jgi:hypothetical protein
MKTLPFVLCLAALPLPGLGQGSVHFSNFDRTSLGPNAPIYRADGTTKLEGSGFMAELFAGASVNSLAPIASTGFRTGNGAGYFDGGTQFILSVNPGADAWAEVRVWNAASGATFDQALASGLPDSWWQSSIFIVHTGDPNLGGAPSVPGALTGLGTSPVYLNAIPEPSPIVLAGLGAVVALFHIRQRSSS